MIRLLVCLLLLAGPVGAVEPDEVLADPGLEARARALSEGLRCPICRNETIDDSHAPIARDLRLVLRERLVAGDSDDQAVAFIVDRYGEYVLLNPPARGTTWALWLAGPGLLLLGAGVAVAYARGRRPGREAAGLTAEEAARVRDLTGG